MQVRNGFVSNSSSSSFIILSTGFKNEDYKYGLYFNGAFKDETLIITPVENEFGWQTEVYDDFHTKAAWCYLMCKLYNKNNEYSLDKLESVIKCRTGCSDIDWTLVDGGYIDHGSVCPSNCLMFNNNCLDAFLFSKESKIVNQNDNY